MRLGKSLDLPNAIIFFRTIDMTNPADKLRVRPITLRERIMPKKAEPTGTDADLILSHSSADVCR